MELWFLGVLTIMWSSGDTVSSVLTDLRMYTRHIFLNSFMASGPVALKIKVDSSFNVTNVVIDSVMC